MIVQTDAGVPQGDGLVPGGMIGSLFDRSRTVSHVVYRHVEKTEICIVLMQNHNFLLVFMI